MHDPLKHHFMDAAVQLERLILGEFAKMAQKFCGQHITPKKLGSLPQLCMRS